MFTGIAQITHPLHNTCITGKKKKTKTKKKTKRQTNQKDTTTYEQSMWKNQIIYIHYMGKDIHKALFWLTLILRPYVIIPNW